MSLPMSFKKVQKCTFSRWNRLILLICFHVNRRNIYWFFYGLLIITGRILLLEKQMLLIDLVPKWGFSVLIHSSTGNHLKLGHPNNNHALGIEWQYHCAYFHIRSLLPRELLGQINRSNGLVFVCSGLRIADQVWGLV